MSPGTKSPGSASRLYWTPWTTDEAQLPTPTTPTRTSLRRSEPWPPLWPLWPLEEPLSVLIEGHSCSFKPPQAEVLVAATAGLALLPGQVGGCATPLKYPSSPRWAVETYLQK